MNSHWNLRGCSFTCSCYGAYMPFTYIVMVHKSVYYGLKKFRMSCNDHCWPEPTRSFDANDMS